MCNSLPSLLNLENKNFLDKTIKKIQDKCGHFVTDQAEILSYVRSYYGCLYENKDHKLKKANLTEILKNKPVSKVPNIELGDLINTKELGETLKTMKHNKSPGMDGFTTEFLKVFWCRLKHFITNAINICFKKGTLSTSLKQCIITCIPKGKKDRSLIGNWRPISLLPVIYKLASGTIANRLKKVLNTIISTTQNGFISGRQISNCTRLIYDIMQVAEEKKLPGLLMLIDFEKAFDSLSWDFLYNSLDFFGFSANFSKWIKLFNNDIKAYILQCGFLSESIKIGRGCRQGDPIAPYLFLIGAEILSLLIKINPEITGFIYHTHEYKLTQFADDTTIILDGSQCSLQAALNTLEIYGSISGLRMNKEKTKLIWIGRKKHCKEKLDVTLDLDWGKQEFILLGIKFNVNLTSMPKLNFENSLQKIQTELKMWQVRHLTPFGKVTVLKSLILAKFIHLFLSLPTPEDVITKLNFLCYRFLWNDKPDKIKRDVICLDYLKGGIKMVNISKFIISLKLTWIRRIFCDVKTQWFNLFSEMYPVQKLSLGFDLSKTILLHMKNEFWIDIITYWQNFCKTKEIRSNSDIVCSPLWYNTNISKDALYFPKWSNKGISMVGDIIDDQWNVLNPEVLKRKFEFSFNILDYYRLKYLVKTFITTYKEEGPSNYMRPCCPSHLKILYKSKKGCKDFYNLLLERDTKYPVPIPKWEELVLHSKYSWTQIYKICCKSIKDNKFIWFQYKILNNILDTQYYLYKIKILDDNTCRLCNQHPETILHLFAECTKSSELWRNVKHWVFTRLGLNLDFDSGVKIFGYNDNNENFWPLNFMLIVTRYYIYWCAKKGFQLNIFHLQREIKKRFNEQKISSFMNNSNQLFEKRWSVWQNLFIDI